MKPIYFDNAATTRIRDEVIEAMANVMKTNFGNASSSHSFGRSSKSVMETSRKAIASFFNVSAGEIVFTSGGTEADNLVLRSAVRDLGVKHIITSKIEHHGVLRTVEQLKKEYDITISWLNVDDKGAIDYNQLEDLLINKSNVLVSLMHINNEIGNLLDLKRIANLCKVNEALFHSDAVQSVGHYKIDLQDIPLDFMAVSAHKFHGPKGIGFAFVRKSSGLKPMIIGGEQERGLRAGTESIHNIVGLQKALTYSYNNLEEEANYIKELKSYFINKVSIDIPNITFNGYSADQDKGSYMLLNLCLPMAPNKSDMILFQLDLKGVACSRGSACQSGSSRKSHVLSEILNADDLEKPSIRFSFSIYNTKEEIDYVIDLLKTLVARQVKTS